MTSQFWNIAIKQIENDSPLSRLVVFRSRYLFRKRCSRDFQYALEKDKGVISSIISLIRRQIYLSECCSEYGLDDSEKEDYFNHYIRDHLPQRYSFLKQYGYEISKLSY